MYLRPTLTVRDILRKRKRKSLSYPFSLDIKISNFDPYGITKIPTRITKRMSLHQQQYYYFTTVEKQNKAVSLHLQQCYYATVKSHVTCRSRMQPTMMNQVILISRSGICSTPASITDIYVSWWKACKGREAFLLHMSMKAFQIVLGEVWCVMGEELRHLILKRLDTST